MRKRTKTAFLVVAAVAIGTIMFGVRMCTSIEENQKRDLAGATG